MKKLIQFIKSLLLYLRNQLNSLKKHSGNNISIMSLRTEILKELYQYRGDGKNYPLTTLLATLNKQDTDDDYATTIKDLLEYRFIVSVLDISGFLQPVTSGTYIGLGTFTGLAVRDSLPLIHKYRITIEGEKYYENINTGGYK